MDSFLNSFYANQIDMWVTRGQKSISFWCCPKSGYWS